MPKDERRAQFDMCAGEVTLDLLQLRKVVACAMSNARNELNRVEREVRAKLDQAHIEKDSHEHYILLCNANTHAGYLERYARQYREAVQAYFHVCEAIKRGEIKIVRE